MMQDLRIMFCLYRCVEQNFSNDLLNVMLNSSATGLTCKIQHL